MASSAADTPDEYLAELPADRRAAIATVRATVLEHLPDGIEETMAWGMITYQVPLGTFPDTHDGRPLPYAALASQKQYMSLYLTALYSDPDRLERFREEYNATGKRLDMGKSCVRFRTLDQLPLDVVGRVIGDTTVEELIEKYRTARD